LALPLLGFVLLGAAPNLSAMPSPAGVETTPIAMDDASPASTRLAQAQPAPTPTAPATAAPAAAPASTAAGDEPIGNVAALTGIATVIRNKDSIALKLKDDIYLNDTVATSADSSLGVTFNDATTFHLSANSKLTIDNYVYEDGGKQNAGIFDIGKGTVAFVAAAVAKTGDMKITTPTASLGIRGTTGVVEVPEGATAAGANNVNIKLYPDADGRVGRIEVNDRMGSRLGALTQGASGFAIRPGAGGRFAAAPLTISPREAARDQGFVRQVHATQSVGRQIVTEQRAFRRANPGLNNRGNQPGPQRQNQLPGQNRPGQPQPAAPNRQENRQGQQKQGLQKQEPRGPQQPGQPARPGQNPRPGGQPVTPPQPGQNPNVKPGAQPPTQPAVQPRQGGLQSPPGVQRPGLPNRPALQRPRPPAPKGKPEKKKR
jgi:FecR protein